MDKKGWIKIVEAFMAIVLLLSFLIVLLAQINDSDKEISAIEKNNFEILRGIETSPILRSEVLSLELPFNSSDGDIPPNLKEHIENKTLFEETCILYVCEINSLCEFNEDLEKEVYSSEVSIFSNSTVYSPRKLKIFCYI